MSGTTRTGPGHLSDGEGGGDVGLGLESYGVIVGCSAEWPRTNDGGDGDLHVHAPAVHDEAVVVVRAASRKVLERHAALHARRGKGGSGGEGGGDCAVRTMVTAAVTNGNPTRLPLAAITHGKSTRLPIASTASNPPPPHLQLRDLARE